MKLSSAIALADACGVSIEWLATGRNPAPAPVEPLPTAAPLDVALMAKVLLFVDQLAKSVGREVSPETRALWLINAYDLATTRDPPAPDAVPTQRKDE